MRVAGIGPAAFSMSMKRSTTELNALDPRGPFVGVEGIEPSAFVLSGQRSTTELHTHNCFVRGGQDQRPACRQAGLPLNYTPDFHFFKVSAFSSWNRRIAGAVSMPLLKAAFKFLTKNQIAIPE